MNVKTNNDKWPSHPTEFWERLSDGRVVCTLCPRGCKLKDGQRGFCFVRGAEKQKVVFYGYGATSGLHLDPMEKKPLYHFYPGEGILSLGGIGCNLGCQFCQNWHISKATDMRKLSTFVSPEEVVQTALNAGVSSIAFTYNEPITSLEFNRDIAFLAKERNINSVAITAGFVEGKAREDFFSFIDATNVDLKAFNQSFYKKLTAGGKLSVILDTLIYVKKHTNVWIEITNLIIPGKNDDTLEIEQMCKWIVSNLGVDVPLHFSAFHPDWKMIDSTIVPTSVQTIMKAWTIAKEVGIRYVYTGNISYERAMLFHKEHIDTGNTYCHNCQNLLIERRGFNIVKKSWGLIQQNKCGKCLSGCAGVFNEGP